MATTEWRLLSSRQEGGAALAWRTGVPAALEAPLRESLEETLDTRLTGIGVGGIPERVLLRLDLIVPDDMSENAETATRSDEARWLLAWRTPVELLPDVLDAVLNLLPIPPAKVPIVPKPYDVTVAMEALGRSYANRPTQQRESLARLLADALSIYRLQANGRGLERRSDLNAETSFTEAVKSAEEAVDAGSASTHLQTAWGSLHALHPDPGKAYGEAIKAVEAAAHALVEPNNRKATLGTMIRVLRDNSSRFTFVVGNDTGRGITALIECRSLLWDGQTSRHGSRAETRVETPEEQAST
jgi:hypothetical protein